VPAAMKSADSFQRKDAKAQSLSAAEPQPN